MDLDPKTAALAQSIAEDESVTDVDIVRRALAAYVYFKRARMDGKKIQLVQPDDQVIEVTFV